MQSVGQQLIIAAIPVLPALVFFALALFGRLLRENAQYVAILGVTVSLVFSVFALLFVAGVIPGGGQPIEFAVSWIDLGQGGSFSMGVYIDGLAAMMLVVVCFVSLMIQLYSGGFMEGDRRFAWYYAVLNLFTASMLGLVLAPNFIELYICWELVGLCSYLLIGHWYEKPSARDAALKAFIVTRISDAALFTAIIIFWRATGTTSFDGISEAAQAGFIGGSLFTAAVILVFLGAVGKSAQFPLHVWLPYAMEGPTPVSALIHAATMVAAGVYLVARTFPLFEAAPQALTVVAAIGGFTAIFAASMGLASNDIKRVLAYSTVSQLGYMMLALGAGSLAAGMFHLFTHAFFKALLFLAAGSVIHAVGTNDITEMGGLKRFMPRTYWTMGIGSLSLAGFPLFAGFWSKDEVLAAAASGAGPILLAFGVITVFLTAFYTFRMFFLTFHGALRGPVEAAVETAGHHPAALDAETHAAGLHESDAWMTLPLIVLAIPALLIGFWGSPLFNNGFQRFLEGSRYVDVQPKLVLDVLGAMLAIAGIAAAWVWYGARAYVTEPLLRFGTAYRVLNRRYYIDEFYMRLIAIAAIGLAAAVALFDRQGLDGLVNGIAALFASGGRVLRTTQTGRVQNYGVVLFGGMAVIALVLVIVPLIRP